MPTPIILDCDPGHDDALAILLAVGNPEIDLRAVTVVGGNQIVEKGSLNARRMLSLAGATEVPVAAGHAGPFIGELRIGADVHGETGLDGWAFDEPVVDLYDGHALDLMAEVLTSSVELVTIVSIGPQTNVAALLLGAPQLRPKIHEIICMGGATHRGNTEPYAEYNIFVDPEAAAVVLGSGIPMTYCGLNVTHQALVTEDVMARLGQIGSVGKAVESLLRFRSSTYDRIWQLPDAPLHDPVAVACVIDPGLLTFQAANVEIELRGQYTRGATVIDLAAVTGRQANARVAMGLDVEMFWKLMTDALESL